MGTSSDYYQMATDTKTATQRMDRRNKSKKAFLYWPVQIEMIPKNRIDDHWKRVYASTVQAQEWNKIGLRLPHE